MNSSIYGTALIIHGLTSNHVLTIIYFEARAIKMYRDK